MRAGCVVIIIIIECAGVLGRCREAPQELLIQFQNGCRLAQKKVRAIQKCNHQLVDRAEVAADDPTLHKIRRKANARSLRKRRLEAKLAN